MTFKLINTVRHITESHEHRSSVIYFFFIRRLLYVSTLDGKLSALDMTQNGKLEWTVDTGSYIVSSKLITSNYLLFP